MNESVRAFITRLLNMPVSRSRGPYNPEDWGLWSEMVRPCTCSVMHRAMHTQHAHTTGTSADGTSQRWSYLSDDLTMSALELENKETFALRRRRNNTMSNPAFATAPIPASPSGTSTASASTNSSAPPSPSVHPIPAPDGADRGTTVFVNSPLAGPAADFGAEATCVLFA